LVEVSLAHSYRLAPREHEFATETNDEDMGRNNNAFVLL